MDVQILLVLYICDIDSYQVQTRVFLICLFSQGDLLRTKLIIRRNGTGYIESKNLTLKVAPKKYSNLWGWT